MKNHESWASIIPKFYPQLNFKDTAEHRMVLKTAMKYKNPHDWSGEPQKTKSLAMEPDTYEFDAAGNGTRAEFDYEVIFKLTSHFVHSTVSALQSHLVERGDTFKIRGRWEERKGSKSLFHVLVFVSKTFVCGFQALHQEQPEDVLQRMHQQMQSY